VIEEDIGIEEDKEAAVGFVVGFADGFDLGSVFEGAVDISAFEGFGFVEGFEVKLIVCKADGFTVGLMIVVTGGLKVGNEDRFADGLTLAFAVGVGLAVLIEDGFVMGLV